MSSDRHSSDGDLPDGVVDRDAGYTHNPNSDEEVAANRARFEAVQRELQQNREHAAEELHAVQDRVEQQYDAAQHDPAHQDFVPEQLAHQRNDPPHRQPSHEEGSQAFDEPVLPGNVEIARHVPMPTTRRGAEEFNNEE